MTIRRLTQGLVAGGICCSTLIAAAAEPRPHAQRNRPPVVLEQRIEPVQEPEIQRISLAAPPTLPPATPAPAEPARLFGLPFPQARSLFRKADPKQITSVAQEAYPTLAVPESPEIPDLAPPSTDLPSGDSTHFGLIPPHSTPEAEAGYACIPDPLPQPATVQPKSGRVAQSVRMGWISRMWPFNQ